MAYPNEQVEELKRYCSELSLLSEGGTEFFHLAGLHLPNGCKPDICDGLLCPTPREGYPSRLYLSVKVSCPFGRNWNGGDARIAEKNWFAFSWKVEPTPPSLAQILLAHLAALTRP
jgi:hypothetical protein